MKIKKVACIIGLSFLWSGCVVSKSQSPREHWKNLSSTSSITTAGLASDQALAVFIRDHNSVYGPTVNVFIEGEYLASLQDGAYKAIPVCAAPTRIAADFTQPQLSYTQLRQKDEQYSFEKGKIYYFKVASAEKGAITVQQLTAQEAKPVLHNLQEQVHTLARVEKNRNCPKVIHTTSNITLPQPVIKKYTLQASTLFAYAKSGPGDILKKGREEVAAIAAEIARDQEQISHITVIGYTDPVGTDISNKKLSERRAQTVRSILVQNGVPMRTILAEGRGEQDLVVNDCQARYPTNKVARAECDLPNRRVEIVTYGMTTK